LTIKVKTTTKIFPVFVNFNFFFLRKSVC